ncbi:MAG: class I SAM-dependent methyltransferase [Candidatus Kapaibacterium sp.]
MTQLPADEILSHLGGTPWVCTFSGMRQRDVETGLPLRVVLRCTGTADDASVSVDTFTQKQHTTRSFRRDDAALGDTVRAMTQQGFSQAHVQTPAKDVYMRGTKKSVLRRTTRPSKSAWEATTEQVGKKRAYLRTDNAFTLLRALGFVTDTGEAIPAMSAKFRQVNHAMNLMLASSVFDAPALRIVDAGCGKAYLSLALAYYLKNERGCDVRLIGIDANAGLIAWCTETAGTLGMDYCTFVCSPIAEVTLQEPIDVLLALHACDTATDDALALALRDDAKAVFAAPCCHHYVNAQLTSSSVRETNATLLRDGIVRERIADMITDTMRRDVLRSKGYTAELIEFVAQEHTMKNIMIKAEKSDVPQKHRESAREQVRALGDEWQVRSRLVEILNVTE